MEEVVISFETAMLAKEKGFNIKTNQAYIYRGVEHQENYYKGILTNNILLCDISAPTQSLLQKWLREEHSKDIIPPLKFHEGYSCSFIAGENAIFFNTYEEALEAELFKQLNLL